MRILKSFDYHLKTCKDRADGYMATAFWIRELLRDNDLSGDLKLLEIGAGQWMQVARILKAFNFL